MHGEIIKGSDAETNYKSDNTKLPVEILESNVNILYIYIISQIILNVRYEIFSIP